MHLYVLRVHLHFKLLLICPIVLKNELKRDINHYSISENVKHKYIENKLTKSPN